MIPDPAIAASSSALPANSTAARFASPGGLAAGWPESGRGLSGICFSPNLDQVWRITLLSLAAGIAVLLDIRQNCEYFPFVAIRILNPRLILQRVAAACLHFIAWAEARVLPAIPNRLYVFCCRHLKSKMRQRPSPGLGAFVEREIERWILDIEFGVTWTDLERFDPKQLPVEPYAGLHGCNVEGDVSFQYGRINIFV